MAKSAKEKLAEIAELEALLAEMPDEEDEKAVATYEEKNKDPNEVVEIRYRRVKRKHFASLKHELECEECGVTFHAHLPALFDGRLCGTNCAEIVIEKVRDLLAKFDVPHVVIAETSPALLNQDPPHLVKGGRDPRRVGSDGTPIEDTPEDVPVSAPVSAPLTLKEKIAARLK